MPKPYEDDLRNAERNDIAGTLAARQSPFGYGLEQAGRAMTPSAASGALATAAGAVPIIGGGSLLPGPGPGPLPQAQQAPGVLMQQMQRMRPMRRL